MILETFCVGPMRVNCYILAPAKGAQAIIIDPGADCQDIKRVLEKHKLSPALVINTHGHYDHIGCDDKFNAPVYIHPKDAGMLTSPGLNLSAFFSLPYSVSSKIILLEDNQAIELAGIELKALHIPGHTPGGIALKVVRPQEKIVFTGDSLFYRSIGRSDLEGGDEGLLIKTIKEKLLTLPADTIVYPGHGPSSTIGEERKNNPFLT